MPTPHKHAAVIKAWADGQQIQFRRDNSEVWCDCAGVPEWYTYNEYRIKPVIIKYRNFLWFSHCAQKTVVGVVSDCDQEREPRERWEGFIRWLGDWQEVEVCPKLDAQSLYVAQILRMYLSGEDNAYEAFKNVYGATHEQAEIESDVEYIVRCAEQDFFDGEQNAAVYQDVYNEINNYWNP